MVAWSSIGLNNISRGNLLRSLVGKYKNAYQTKGGNLVHFRASSHNVFKIRPSEFQYTKFKDLLNFYLLLGIIPLTLLTAYVNIFIGPAKLALIPDGYEPKHWEYFEHPISRFFARYCYPSPQEMYERNLHELFIAYEKKMLWKLKQKIHSLMKERLDYQAWYFVPSVNHNYIRKENEISQEFMDAKAGRARGILRP